MAESNTARERAKDKDQDVDKAAGDAATGGDKQGARTAAAVRAAMDAEPLQVVNGDAVLVTSEPEGSDVSAYVEDASSAAVVVIKQDIIERFFYPDTKRPAFRQLYVKGQTVQRAVLEERLAGIRAAGSTIQARSGVLDPANPAGVDASTLAAGTYPGIAASVSQEQSPQGTTETK